ncbi:MAG: hypothetical protein AAB900_00010 [Patescibacteria group bacterium]
MDNLNDNNLKDINVLADKSQRLAKAVYLVSSFISDNDPIKRKLKEEALSLLEDCRGFVPQNSVLDTSSASVDYLRLERLGQHFQLLFSWLDLATTSGFISEMNFSILRQEITALLSSITRLNDPNAIHKFISNQTSTNTLASPTEVFNSNLKDKYLDHKTVLKNLDQTYSPKTKSIPAPLSRSEKPAGSHQPKAQDKVNRKKNILDFVTGKGWTSIKDIAAVVTDCSEKTIQRELLELVAKGRLKKQGERRWSRYMAA